MSTVYKKINQIQLDDNLSLIANKLKERTNISKDELIFPEDFSLSLNNSYKIVDWLDKTKPAGEIIYNGTNIPAYFLYNRNKITSFSAPNATGTVGSSAFAGTSSLKNSLFLPKCSAGNSSFSDSSASTIVLNTINKSTTYNFASALAQNIDILSNFSIGTHCFSSLSYIQNFIFRSTSIVALGSVEWGLPLSVFGEGKRGANIYIPKILYDHLGDGTSQDYKSATNWATIDGYGTINWKCIEESEYYTHYADGTLLPDAYISSTGKEYLSKMEIDLASSQVQSKLTAYGMMEHLEELTLTGTARAYITGALLGSESMFSQTVMPALKKLYIQPTKFLANGSNNEETSIRCGHYIFNGTNLTELVLGRVGGPYFSGGGYFRHGDLPCPPGTDSYQVGSLDGLTITVYTNQYSASAGFMLSPAPNTTVICKDYLTGEILTPPTE